MCQINQELAYFDERIAVLAPTDERVRRRQSVANVGPVSVSPPKPLVFPIADYGCVFGSGRSANIEEHLSAPLGVKNRFTQCGKRIGCRNGHLNRAGSDERYGFS